MISIATMVLVLIIAAFALILIVQFIGAKVTNAVFTRKDEEVERELTDLRRENRRLKAECHAMTSAKVEVKEIGDWTSLRYGGSYDS